MRHRPSWQVPAVNNSVSIRKIGMIVRIQGCLLERLPLRGGAAAENYFELLPARMVSNPMQMQLFALFMVLIGAGAPASADTAILIFPPENLTKARTLSWIAEGLAVALSEECQVPGIETVSWEERIRSVEASDLPPNSVLSRASMIRVAQRLAVDRIVFGSYSGSEESLRIELRMLDLKSMRLSGPIVANGSAAALPQLENELAWVILSAVGRTGAISRESYRARTRTIPNKTYAHFIGCLGIADEAERVQELLKAVEMFRDFPQASYFIGVHFFQAADCTKAIQYLKPALREVQYYAETQFMLGTCNLKQDNPGEAIQAYNAFLARRRALEVLNNVGVAHLRRGDYALAVQNLVEARNLASTDLTIGLNLGVLRHLQRDEAAMMSLVEELLKAHPEQGILQFLYGTALAGLGQTERSEVAFEQARSLGIDVAEMKRQNPLSWTRIFPVWIRRPESPWLRESRSQEDGKGGQRH
jgi:tetratricopeptide (TPR) repeat protein